MNRTQLNFFRHNRGDFSSKHKAYATQKRFKTPYVYRRETSLSATDNEGRPNLTISGKLREKENFIFGGAPLFNAIPNDDRGRGGGEYTSSNGTKISKKELEDFQKEEERKKQKKKDAKKNAPSNEEIREHLRMIRDFHKKEVNETMPSAYPLLGAVAGEDEEESGSTGRGKNSKAENSDTVPIPYKVRSGRNKSKKATPALKRKRGKK